MCLYQLHKLLDISNQKHQQKPINQPKLMCIVYLLKELNIFINELEAFNLLCAIETLDTRTDQINVFNSFSNPILVAVLLMELLDSISLKCKHRKEFQSCLVAIDN